MTVRRGIRTLALITAALLLFGACDSGSDDGGGDTGATGDDTGETGDDTAATAETGDGTAETGDDTTETGDDTGAGATAETGEPGGAGDMDAAGGGSDATTAGDAGSDAGPDDPPNVCPEPTGARPMRRSEHAGIYDPIGDRVVMFGGTTAIPINCSFPTSTFENETWIYDVQCDQWHQVADTPEQGRTRHMAVYDSGEHRMLVFGGRWRAGTTGNYTLFNSVIAFDLESETWNTVETTGAPAARINAALAYDPAGHRLVLFGGNTSASGFGYTAQNDTWILDLHSGAWSPIATASVPSKRLFTGSLWDEARATIVIHGGADETAFNDNAQYFDGVYALDPDAAVATWTRLDVPGGTAPDGRFWGGLVRDAERDRYLLFGGHDDGAQGNRNDLWAFLPETSSWELLQLADTWNKPANGVCSFPPDFTNVDYDAPERRNAHVFVGGGDSAFTTGGKTDCGAIDDMVELDLTDDTWIEWTTSTVGESCLRKGGLQCNDLCF